MDVTILQTLPSTLFYQRINWLSRSFAYGMVFLTFNYLFNNYLIVWQEWPGVAAYFFNTPAEDASSLLAWVQLLSYLLILPLTLLLNYRNQNAIIESSNRIDAWTMYLIRSAFWSVVLIGFVDAIISFLRVEDLLLPIVGDSLTSDLGRAAFRATYLHFPLILASLIIAKFVKNISVSWLALLVVFSELLIVLTRFVFSYEQTFMGDLVRFWYAGLFLFSSAFTLKSEGHVRVDILYAHKPISYKAKVNCWGVLLLGLPISWVILLLGLWERTSIINSPIYSFEISQASYGLYIKYLMAAYLVIFAVSMIMQFCSYFLRHVAILVAEVEVNDDMHDEIPV